MDTLMQDKQLILDRAEEFVIEIFRDRISKNHKYHSIEHTLSVRDAAKTLSLHAGISPEATEVLQLSALFHDTGFSKDQEDHEEHSKSIAKAFLENENYPADRIEKIMRCIEATKLSHKPHDKLEMIIKDADLSGLGGEDYFEVAENLRNELNMVNKEGIDEAAWEQINLQFLKDHTFFTHEAKALFGARKKENIKTLEKRLGVGKEKKKKKKTPGPTSIASSKSAQTQFKTSLRNHIDLSAIADNKANIMLSVNALIITISFPVLMPLLRQNIEMLAPTLILLAVCICSIIFATLATRPIKMKGLSSPEQIKSRNANLFFFGNFYRMSFKDYQEGMRAVIADDENLDSAITRDLFFLGKALGKKYNYLRICYNIFMFGIIISVFAFAITFILTNNG
jgi:predicted metal-dependent HD superfamily phosphohydrolase